jgi:hypothetical protein
VTLIACPEPSLSDPSAPCPVSRIAVALVAHLVNDHMVAANVAMARVRTAAERATAPPAPVAEPAEPSPPASKPPEDAMAFQPKTCPDCKKTFTPTGPAQKRCPTCAAKKHAQRGNRARPERTGGKACSYCHRADGTHSPKCKRSGPRKPPGRPRTPLPAGADGAASGSPVVTVLDQEIAKLERQLAALKGAREILA